MKEIVAISVIIIFYLFFSYKIHGTLLKVNKYSFILLSILYLVGTYGFFELINQVEILLRDRKIYFEFGHAKISLLEVMMFCFLVAFANICISIFRKYKRSKESVK